MNQEKIIAELQDVVAAQNEAINELTAKIEAIESAKPIAPSSSVATTPTVLAAKEVSIGKDTYIITRPKFNVQDDKGTLTPVDLNIVPDADIKKYLDKYPAAFTKK